MLRRGTMAKKLWSLLKIAVAYILLLPFSLFLAILLFVPGKAKYRVGDWMLDVIDYLVPLSETIDHQGFDHE
jgi:hypothetical protein